jgi:hypothetical protein
MVVKELFNKSKLQKKLKNYNLETKQIVDAKEIFSRWLNDVDTTKETEHQESFLREFFVRILNYQAIAGKKDNTIWWESGSVVDGKKPDGILGFNLVSYKSESLELEQAGDVRVVIELKDSTVKLDAKQNRKEYKGTPVEQAFMYVAKVGGNCEFVIVSNFLETRIYKAGDESKCHVFKLEELANDEAKIKEFFFLLSKGRLFTSKPNSSVVHELIETEDKGKEIEKEFYTHYKNLREQIWADLIDQNKEKHYGRNFYLYKAQKLIDRIIFIRFCRENGALDSDVVSDALSYKFAKGKYYEILKDLFNAMNEGNPEIGIAKFNGGLFAVDKDLDCLNISDDIISKIVILYDYNFGSDLDVNILGHIFEQSISDLEDLTNKSDERKRKKDGVFYTPSYITEYIVNEAVGGWLADRKLEITAQSKAIEGSKDWWQAYAEKLKTIKIVDPACGSGAFLVKVFDYLQAQWIEVHKYIKTDYTYKDILKNNIYGVDLNPTSVGITKLSLWLKTAHYKEPLTTLDNNIKVGNSLIDNEDVAGYYYEHDGEFRSEVIVRDLLSRENLDKDREDGIKTSLAFKWKEQFSNVFATGGFDVIVGNPPWGADLGNSIKYLKSFFVDAKLDSSEYFLFLADTIVNQNGYISFIVPKSIIFANSWNYSRKLLLSLCIKNLDDYGIAFNEVDLESISFLVKKKQEIQKINRSNWNPIKKFAETKERKNLIPISQNTMRNSEILLLSDYSSITEKIINLIYSKGLIANFSREVYRGIYIPDNIKKLCLDSGDKFFINKVPDASRYLIKKLTKINLNIAEISQSFLKNNSKDRIIIKVMRGNKINATFCDKNILSTEKLVNFIPKEGIDILYALAIINSKLFSFYTQKALFSDITETSRVMDDTYLSKLPIPQISESEQQPFIKKAQDMLDLNKELSKLSNELLELLRVDLGISKSTKKLESWYNLQDNEFFAEVEKQNKNLSLKDKSKWQNHFEEEKTKALELQNKISTTDNEIDAMVYALYGLNEEEIKTIEDFDI